MSDPEMAGDSASAAVRERAGHLKVALNYDAEMFNESYKNVLGHGGYFVGNNIFNRLVILDVYGDASIHPDLAERWDILDSGATYRFHLRRDVQWHDGHPFTARDVAVTYGTAIEHGHAASAWLMDVREISVLDDHTVELRLQAPNGGFLARLGMFVYTSIMPAHLYEGTDWATNPANWAPVGTGAYRFVSWERERAIETEANPHFYRGRPGPDRLTFVVVPDGNESFEMLKRGEIDFSTRYAPCQDLADLEASPGVGVMVDLGNALAHIGFNVRRAPWSDQRVREAVASAIDRAVLTAAVCPRAPAVNHPYLERVTWAYDPNTRLPAHDLQHAEALLQAAGLERDADGIRVRARMVTRDVWHYWDRAARLIGEQLKPLGIAVQPVQLTPSEWNAQVSGTHDFDMLVDSGDIGPDPSFLELVLGTGGARNFPGYSNPEVDALLAAGRMSTEISVRGPAYRKALAILAHDLPRIPLMQHPLHVAYRTEWEGWSWDDGVRGSLPFWSFERVRAKAAAPAASTMTPGTVA